MMNKDKIIMVTIHVVAGMLMIDDCCVLDASGCWRHFNLEQTVLYSGYHSLGEIPLLVSAI